MGFSVNRARCYNEDEGLPEHLFTLIQSFCEMWRFEHLARNTVNHRGSMYRHYHNGKIGRFRNFVWSQTFEPGIEGVIQPKRGKDLVR